MRKKKKEKIIKEEKIVNYTIRNLSIRQICPNLIDNVIISIIGNQHYIDLPSNMGDDNFKKWFRGPGGIFIKDISRFLKRRSHGKYILIKGEGEKSILRIIEDEELLDFETKHLVHGKIKDKSYMILKTLKEDQKLTNNIRYIVESPVIEEFRIPDNDNISFKDEEDSFGRSVSLFND